MCVEISCTNKTSVKGGSFFGIQVEPFFPPHRLDVGHFGFPPVYRTNSQRVWIFFSEIVLSIFHARMWGDIGKYCKINCANLKTTDHNKTGEKKEMLIICFDNCFDKCLCFSWTHLISCFQPTYSLVSSPCYIKYGVSQFFQKYSSNIYALNGIQRNSLYCLWSTWVQVNVQVSVQVSAQVSLCWATQRVQ